MSAIPDELLVRHARVTGGRDYAEQVHAALRSTDLAVYVREIVTADVRAEHARIVERIRHIPPRP